MLLQLYYSKIKVIGNEHDKSFETDFPSTLGFNVQGVFMQNWDIRDETGSCSVENDYQDAKYVCNKLNIKLNCVNFVKEYWSEVFWYV